MKRALKALAIAPSGSTFLAAYQALSRSSRTLAADEVSHLLALLESRERAALAAALDDLPPLSALSPAVHWISRQAARAEGNEEDALLEEFLLDACLTAILDTGNGSAESPYVVICTADERHVCQALGLEPGPQALLHDSGLALDVVQCLDGTDVWFDVSRLVPLPGLKPVRRQPAAHSARNSVKCATGRNRLSQSRP